MNSFKISEEIYKDSLELTEDSYIISNDIYEESQGLTSEKIKSTLIDSYHMSGRYWIWRIGFFTYLHDWQRMCKAGEMQVDASGFKYLKSYPNLSAMEQEYETFHPDKSGIEIIPPAYWAFCNYLRQGDVIIVCRAPSKIIAWGTVNSTYMFKPTRLNGRHYRLVSWNMMDMPFIFSNKRDLLYQIPKEETNHLAEALISKTFIEDSSLPFNFGKNKD